MRFITSFNRSPSSMRLRACSCGIPMGVGRRADVDYRCLWQWRPSSTPMFRVASRSRCSGASLTSRRLKRSGGPQGRYETHAGSSDDPASVASAMNEALADFSRDIARRMQAVLAE